MAASESCECSYALGGGFRVHDCDCPEHGPMTASPAVLEKAARLVDENRVVLSRRARNCAVVAGDTGHYECWATPEGVTCECYQSTHPEGRLCSHAVAAMVAWHERDLAEPTPPPVHQEKPAEGFAALIGGAV